MFHELYEIRDVLVEGSGWSGPRPTPAESGEFATLSSSVPLFI